MYEFLMYFSFISQLYPSVMTGYFAYDCYHVLTHGSEFDSISQRLMDGDVDFFHDELLVENNGFYFEVQIGFDPANMITTNLDLSFFPFKSETKSTDLSFDQIKQAEKLNRKVDKEGLKLASYLHENVICDHSENILYQIVFHGAKVIKIKRILKFKSYKYLEKYIFSLQEKKNQTVSPILTKILKNLGNSVRERK